MRTTPEDVKKILEPKKEKVMGEWQIRNKNKPLIEGRVKSTSKGDTGTTQGPPPSPIKKRKPKTVKEWEDEIDLGGHE